MDGRFHSCQLVCALWPKATVKSLVGACIFTLYFLLPCPALPCPALAPALPCFEFTFCCQGHEEEVTQGTFFPFVGRDRRRKLHKELFFFFPRGRFCAFGFRDSWKWS